MEQAILVYIDLEGEPLKVGQLWPHYRHGRESLSFEYDREWLHLPKRFSLDPALKLAEGTFHASPDKPLFGAIEDSAPYFDLDQRQMRDIIKEEGTAVALWRKEAQRFGIKKDEIDRMASAFEHKDFFKSIQ